MANELEHFDGADLTIYAKPLPLSATPAWATDVVTMAQSATADGYYTADVATPATTYAVFQQAGGSPAATDQAVATITTGVTLTSAERTAVAASAISQFSAHSTGGPVV